MQRFSLCQWGNVLQTDRLYRRTPPGRLADDLIQNREHFSLGPFTVAVLLTQAMEQNPHGLDFFGCGSCHSPAQKHAQQSCDVPGHAVVVTHDQNLAKAGVGTDYKVRYYPEQKSFLEEWVQNIESETESEAMRNQLGEYYLYFEQIKKIKSYQGSQARMPFEFQIQ